MRGGYHLAYTKNIPYSTIENEFLSVQKKETPMTYELITVRTEADKVGIITLNHLCS